ncbi:hypothetical protein [uncultured Sphingomonas sp.]|uniref:hypothetical protein n=1 Tax=uncultured Sphingomonas sp. TaxID=158754 RepID=UPI0035C9885C
MSALLGLLVAIGLAFVSGGAPWLVAASVVAAAWAGTTLPDLDLSLGLGHRSALLHSVLPIAAAAADRRTWPVAAGLGLGIGLHMAADLFPNGMRGYATIKVPLFGSIGAGSSYLWIAVNAGAALTAGAWLLGRIVAPGLAGATLVAVGVVGVGYLLRTDGGWWALALFAGLGWLALRWG